MPELPEVETVRRGLALCLPGTKIVEAKLFTGHTLRFPSVQKFCRDIAGCCFADSSRRGKYLLLQMQNGKYLVIHLGMSGRLLLLDGERLSSLPALTHVRMSISLTGKKVLCLQDPRRFSRVWLVDDVSKLLSVVPSLACLGVEPLSDELTEKYLQTRFAPRRQVIKAVLLDQSVIAGIGNIYADESLFVARIHPLASARRLTKAQRLRLIEAIRTVLSHAIGNGGSSLRNYSDVAGVNGNYQNKAWVYARAGQQCRVCGTLVRKTVVMARSTHFCPRCQPKRAGASHRCAAPPSPAL